VVIWRFGDLVIGLIAAAMGLGAAVPQTADAFDADNLRAWLAAVDRHAPGQADAAVIDVGSWPVDHTLATVNDFVALVRGLRDAQARLAKTGRASDVSYRGIRYPVARLDQLLGLTETESASGDANRIIAHAVILYTDIATFDAIVPRAPSSRVPAPAGQAPLIIQDGRGTAPDADDQSHALQWEFARVLANEVSGASSRDSPVGQWYHAVAAYLESRRQWGAAMFHAQRGLDVRPADPILLFRRGVIHEFYAGPQAQSALQTVEVPRGTRLRFEGELVELRKAEESFRQAVAGDPDWAEARLHWGHVLGAVGRDDDAERELSRARERLTDPALVYYADLFLGRSLAAMGDRPGAQASYARAAAAFPRAQSPLLAESELSRHAGDVPAALEALQRLLSLPQDRRVDPWWTYDVSSSRSAGEMMAAARDALLGAAPR
jgi:tetratricopeptide (TPR) repeat protein